MKEGGAHAVKLEGGAEMAPQIELLTRGGIPVMAHIGFTPQSEHALGGYRVQGRGDTADAAARRRPRDRGGRRVRGRDGDGPRRRRRRRSPRSCAIPTIGIGAGTDCDGQVLVWQDVFGLRTGRMPRFVKQYADVHGVLLDGRPRYAADVRAGTFPGPEHTF